MKTRGSLFPRLAKAFSQLPLENLLWLDKLAQFFLFRASTHLTTPIFLLAVPRGGSTLAYQCIVHRFRLLYLSNLWLMLYKLPFIGGFVSGIFSSIYWHKSTFSSVHGFVPGVLAPAEGLPFWSHWFSCGLTDAPSGIAPDLDPHYLQATLGNLQLLFPHFVSCYLGHSLCVNRLRRCFPNAIFVRVKRNPVRNALSILKAMRSLSVDKFSVFPIEMQPYLDRSDPFKAAAQCYFINKRLDFDIRSQDCFVLNYEDLCLSPDSVMSHFETFARARGVLLRASRSLPVSFTETALSASDQEDVCLLENAFNELEKLHGPML